MYTRYTGDQLGKIMNLVEAVGSGFRNYVGFGGRACRSEYWYWALFVVIFSIVTFMLDSLLFPDNPARLLNSLFSLAVFLPGLAMAIRRLHDIDKSGWWVLIVLIPIVGWIILIVWAIKQGDEANNRFGADPLATVIP